MQRVPIFALSPTNVSLNSACKGHRLVSPCIVICMESVGDSVSPEASGRSRLSRLIAFQVDGRGVKLALNHQYSEVQGVAGEGLPAANISGSDGLVRRGIRSHSVVGQVCADERDGLPSRATICTRCATADFDAAMDGSTSAPIARVGTSPVVSGTPSAPINGVVGYRNCSQRQ